MSPGSVVPTAAEKSGAEQVIEKRRDRRDRSGDIGHSGSRQHLLHSGEFLLGDDALRRDDGDGTEDSSTVVTCDPVFKYAEVAGDCDDDDPNVFPGQGCP